jgi:toxin ParE1/3/4
MPKTSRSIQTWQVDNTVQADADIKKIVRFILEREGSDMAQRILDKFTAAKESLQTLPGRGRIPPELARINVFTYRECQISPYRMIYEISEPESRVSVHMVVDGRRDLPDIMTSRLLQSAPVPE